MQHKKFAYKTLDDIKNEAGRLKIDIPLSENIKVLSKPLEIAGRRIQNRIAIQPMEGCDSEENGAPGTYTLRRYKRFAGSGAGLIWLEAAAVVPEGRTNPKQLMLTEQTADSFKAMVENIRETALKASGFSPVLILQLTHSGRYCKPNGKPAPLIAYQNPVLGKAQGIPGKILNDDYLRSLPEHFARSAEMAAQAGFDGVDVKACHGYLLGEFLSAYHRPGDYGGSFENRTRLLLESVQAAKAAAPGGFIVTSRLNAYDGLAYPNGFGVSEKNPDVFDDTEIIRLVRTLHKDGMPLVNITIGNPYFNPHVNRPSDKGPYEFPEHPLEGLGRMCGCIRQVKKAIPEIAVVASGLSYLRHFSMNQAAGMIENGYADITGFGRQAFAYPDFARDILEKGCLDPQKCCIACSYCSKLMRAGSITGCVVRDSELYAPLFKKYVTL